MRKRSNFAFDCPILVFIVPDKGSVSPPKLQFRTGIGYDFHLLRTAP